MKRISVLLVFILILPLFSVLLSGCGSKEPPIPPVPEYRYQRDGIRMEIKADRQLNLSDDNPHTLAVCMYQLKSTIMFNQMSSNEDGIYQLLDCERFNESVTSAKRLILHPGQNLTYVMDRMRGTRNVALVAGYFVLDQNRMVKVFNIPVIIESKKRARADKLNIFVNLGSQQIAGTEYR